MKYILLTFLVFWFWKPVSAQSGQDELVFKAMQDEMERNHEQLQLPGLPAPYYLSYTLGRSRMFEVVGALGGIIHSFQSNKEAQSGVQMFIGDNRHNSDVSYLCEVNRHALPLRPDYGVLRKIYWLTSDMMYKWALQARAMKQNYLQSNPQSPEEAALADRCPVPAVRQIQTAQKTYVMNLPALEKTVKELSLVFKDYKEIYSSTVAVTGLDLEIFKTTTEGVVLKQPVRYAHLSVTAYVVTDEGCRIDDSYTLLVECPDDLPATEELKKNVRAFADHLLRLKNAPVIKEYYEGPVLFEDAAVSSIFASNLLKRGALFAWRKPKTDRIQPIKTLDSRIGMKIIDNRLTVKNYTSLEKYNGKALLGAYQVDAEGVVPEKEMTLVERGIFKRMLNGSVPTVNAPASTGSSRFVLSPGNGVFTTAPGTIHIKAEKGSKPEKMKAALIKAAKEEGLKYAYIVRKLAGRASRIYRVDLKNGNETQVRFGDISGLGLTNLKRMLEISSKENVSNYILNGQTLSSMIYPASMLVENIEINKSDVKKDKEQVLTFPLQR